MGLHKTQHYPTLYLYTYNKKLHSVNYSLFQNYVINFRGVLYPPYNQVMLWPTPLQSVVPTSIKWKCLNMCGRGGPYFRNQIWFEINASQFCTVFIPHKFLPPCCDMNPFAEICPSGVLPLGMRRQNVVATLNGVISLSSFSSCSSYFSEVS